MVSHEPCCGERLYSREGIGRGETRRERLALSILYDSLTSLFKRVVEKEISYECYEALAESYFLYDEINRAYNALFPRRFHPPVIVDKFVCSSSWNDYHFQLIAYNTEAATVMFELWVSGLPDGGCVAIKLEVGYDSSSREFVVTRQL